MHYLKFLRNKVFLTAFFLLFMFSFLLDYIWLIFNFIYVVFFRLHLLPYFNIFYSSWCSCRFEIMYIIDKNQKFILAHSLPSANNTSRLFHFYSRQPLFRYIFLETFSKV